MRLRTYKELIRISDYYERFRYLQLRGEVGKETFGLHLRSLNQALYRTKRWKRIRDEVIIRDKGCDIAHLDYEIHDRIVIHHMNPITPEDLEEENDYVFDPEFLICVAPMTHNAIHYGDVGLLPCLPIDRKPGDTCPWK